jgi:colicin import membrane protein
VRGGLVTSVMLHAAILGWALFTIQAQRELRVAEPEPIAVDIVSASELTKLRQGVRTAKQLEAEAKESPKAEPAKKEAPKPTPVASAPPPPPPEPPKEEPRTEPPKEVAVATPPPAPAPPVPAPEEQKRLEDMLKEQERQAEEQRRIEEEKKQAELKKKQQEEAKKKKEAELKKKKEEEKKRKEAEAKKKFDADKISALLNKVPDKGAPTPSVPLDEQAKSMKGPVLGAPEGRDQQLSASELAVLRQIIRSCVGPKWNVFGGGEEAQNTIVKIRVHFHPDGRLAAAPQIVNPQNSPFFLAAAESALRAVQACEPYPLPPDKYSVWKDTVLTLNPRDMF